MTRDAPLSNSAHPFCSRVIINKDLIGLFRELDETNGTANIGELLLCEIVVPWFFLKFLLPPFIKRARQFPPLSGEHCS